MTSQRQLHNTLTTAHLEAIADHCFKEAENQFAVAQQIRPTIVVGSMSDQGIEFKRGPSPRLKDLADKTALAMLMDALLQVPEIDFAVTIVESWVVIRPSDSDLTSASVADHPRRTEAVVFNIQSKDCQAIVVNPIHRGPLRLERGELVTQFSGRMARPKPPTH